MTGPPRSGGSLDGAKVIRSRLQHQLIEPPGGIGPSVATDPAEVVRRLCAMQAQDYPGSLWSVGMRCAPECVAADVELALAERRMVRTWPMRGTLHFVAPEDVRWMLALLSRRVLTRARGRHERLGVTPEVVERARAIFVDALSGGHALTRGEMMALLEADGIDTTGQAGYHILWTLSQHAVLCYGPLRERQQTFVLLDEWIPPARDETPLERAEALGRLALRYFEARGPATAADLAWWAGITKTEARQGIEVAGARLRPSTSGPELWVSTSVAISQGDAHAKPSDRVHLLPGFDEYFLGYTDRRLQLGERSDTYGSAVSANGVFSPTLIIDGTVAGTWKRTLLTDRVDIRVAAFRALTRAERTGLALAAERYGRFVGLSANLQL